MINEVKMFGATCDNCGKEWQDENMGWCAMNDEGAIKEQLDNCGWHEGDTNSNEGKDGEHYCPSCFMFDDNDVFILKAKEDGKAN